MIIKIFLSLFLINLFFNSEAQPTGIIVSRIKEEISHLNTDTLFVYSFFCSGCSTSDSCNRERSHYLFWQKNGYFFLKRFDYCENFDKIELAATKNPLKYYLTHERDINKEEIKPPTYRIVSKTGDKLDTSVITTSIDHSYYYGLTIQVKDKTIRKIVDVYDLNSIKSDEGLKNIYYNYNQRTQTKALIDKIVALIKRLEADKKFIISP